jgi:hypothetical protein
MKFTTQLINVFSTGNDTWLKSAEEVDKTWTNITDLEYGMLVTMRVVAMNGIEETATSEPRSIVIGQTNSL